MINEWLRLRQLGHIDIIHQLMFCNAVRVQTEMLERIKKYQETFARAVDAMVQAMEQDVEEAKKKEMEANK